MGPVSLHHHEARADQVGLSKTGAQGVEST